MNLDDLKDRLITESRQLWEKIQDSSAYNQVRDKYENLNPQQQKAVLIASAAVISLSILSVPYGHLSVSWENTSTFTEKRDLIRDLQKVSREVAEAPQIQTPPSSDSIRSTIDRELTNARILPEQNKGIQNVEVNSNLLGPNLASSALQINLAKLNLRQIVDLGWAFQSISSSVKLKDIELVANSEDERYYDVKYKLVSLNVPEAGSASFSRDDDSFSGEDDEMPPLEEGETVIKPTKKSKSRLNR